MKTTGPVLLYFVSITNTVNLPFRHFEHGQRVLRGWIIATVFQPAHRIVLNRLCSEAMIQNEISIFPHATDDAARCTATERKKTIMSERNFIISMKKKERKNNQLIRCVSHKTLNECLGESLDSQVGCFQKFVGVQVMLNFSHSEHTRLC